MKQIVHVLIFLFLFSITCTNCSSEKKKVQELPPNIVLIFTDDQGYSDLSCFGATSFATPNIDKMASEGIRLTHFNVAQPVCSASRAALLTGCYPNRIGISGALMPNAQIGLNPDEVTIAELLQSKGYATAAYGKWHLGDLPPFSPLEHGFDEFFGIPYSNDMWPNHPQQGSIFNFPALPLIENKKVIDTLTDQSDLTTQITEKAISFIERNKERPFFLYVPHPQPHVPLFVSDKFKGKSENGLYGDVIMELDWSVGQINNTLKRLGLEDNTIVIFTSDNGPWLNYGGHAGSALPLKEGKGTNWEGGVREPFVMKYPKELVKGRVIETPVMSIDLLPTIAHLANANLPPSKIDGLNVWEVLTGEESESPHEAFYYYYRKNELWAVKSGNWKMYFPHTYRTLNNKPTRNDGLPVTYEYITLEKPELYNLKSDISEQNNIYNDHPEVVDRLNQLAEKIRIELGDDLTNQEGTAIRPVGKI